MEEIKCENMAGNLLKILSFRLEAVNTICITWKLLAVKASDW